MEKIESIEFPLLPLRDVVVYPHVQTVLLVGRDISINALKVDGDTERQRIFVTSQIDPKKEHVKQEDLHEYGTICEVLAIRQDTDNNGYLRVTVLGLARARIESLLNDKHEPLDNCPTQRIFANVIPLPTLTSKGRSAEAVRTRAIMEITGEQFVKYSRARLVNDQEVIRAFRSKTDFESSAYYIASRLEIDFLDRQEILNTNSALKLAELLEQHIESLLIAIQVERDIEQAARARIEQNHREYHLNEKLKAIRHELTGEEEDEDDELWERLEAAKLPKEVRKKAVSEFKKLKSMPQSSSESSVVRGYLEWILDTPWLKSSKIKYDLAHAKTVLDADHHGLEDVKDRILEYLAVQSRVKNTKGSILCLVGPPGVGKTSLGESIARATGRKFVRMALGGVRDEAEIRGHRRTYIGSIPGKIVSSLAKVSVNNPLFLLDEIDKMGRDHRGGPEDALLEVLDPSQNKAFNDHYLELDLDLSNVLFICTANSLDMPQPLLDRMEIIRLAGYTEDEKLAIAQKYLLPRAIKDNGVKDGEIEIKDSAILGIIRHYTREAGVRDLERQLQKICRKVVRQALQDAPKKTKTAKKPKTAVISVDNLHHYLGVQQFDHDFAEKQDEIGRVTGLAWTSVGGELLNIETAAYEGKGELSFTGSLGDVMKESIRAAMSVAKASADRYGISMELVKTRDIHVHMPEGATPKDGPSAGIALTTALVSSLTKIPVRADIAMTGEVTLRGKVLRIGGLKEKLLAAHRGGIKEVLIPKDNVRDLAEIPENIKNTLTITAVEHIDEVLYKALTRALTPIQHTNEVRLPV